MGTTSIALVATDTVFTGDAGLAHGGSLQMLAIASPSLDTIQAGKLDWSVSDTAVLRVSPEGMVTGLRAGTASVTASAGGFIASRTIGVWLVDSVHIYRGRWPGSLHPMILGDTSRQTASVILTAGRGVPNAAGLAPRWSSSDAGIVSIDTAGLMRAHAIGKVLITLTSPVEARVTSIDTQTVQVFAASQVRITMDAVPEGTTTPAVASLRGTVRGTVAGSPRPYGIGVTVRSLWNGTRMSANSFNIRIADDTTAAWSTGVHGLTLGSHEVVASVSDATGLRSTVTDTIVVTDPKEEYTVTWLPSAGMSSPRPTDIHETGLIVGYGYPSASERAVLWRDGVMTMLEAPLPGNYRATAVNAAGTVVGQRSWVEAGTTCRTAVRWLNGVMEALPGQHACIGAVAGPDINDAGHVLFAADTGWLLLTESGLQKLPFATPARLDEQSRVIGSFTGVQTWVPGTSASASGSAPASAPPIYSSTVVAINNRGGVLLVENFGSPTRYFVQGVFESASTTFDIPLLPIHGTAVDINDSNWVVGKYGESFYVSGEGRILRIDGGSDVRMHSVVGITNAGEIIGTATLVTSPLMPPQAVKLTPR